LALTAVLFVVVVVALKFGAVPVSLYALGRDVLRFFLGQTSQISTDYGLIIWNIRGPRILLGIIVGASLSVAGTSFQALLRNPLADPYVLGVSSGASVGAILALIAAPYLSLSPALAGLLTPLGAFIGAAATIAAVYLLGRRDGEIDSTTLLLGGVITGSFLSAIITLLMGAVTSGNNRGMVFWLMGNLSTSFQKSVYWFLGAGFFLATGAIYTTANDLNLLLAGEKEAMHLGVDVRRVRLVVYLAASFLTGLAVSVSGSIAYVGLIVPHVMRLIFGSDHRTLLPTAALGGAIAVVFADTLARTVVAPTEIAVGAVRHRRRPPLHLPPSQEARVSAASSHARRLAEAGRSAYEVRLSVEQVSYAHSANPAQAPLFTLEATSFQVRPGEIVAILGPNASGKSTLLKLISGALAPLSGRILLDGFVTHSLTPRTRAQRIAVVQQESTLLFPARAWEFVLQGRHAHGRSLRFESEDDILIAKNALVQVGAADLSDRWMDQISGGEKQRVILARALAQQPLLLLLDEPTLHLDIAAQIGLLDSLRRLAGENRYTVVVVTHELNLAAEYADQVVLMQRGRCLRVGPPASIYQRELLEQVFQTPLTVEFGSNGRPRVTVLPGT